MDANGNSRLEKCEYQLSSDALKELFGYVSQSKDVSDSKRVVGDDLIEEFRDRVGVNAAMTSKEPKGNKILSARDADIMVILSMVSALALILWEGYFDS